MHGQPSFPDRRASGRVAPIPDLFSCRRRSRTGRLRSRPAVQDIMLQTDRRATWPSTFAAPGPRSTTRTDALTREVASIRWQLQALRELPPGRRSVGPAEKEALLSDQAISKPVGALMASVSP
jgi:hypothetical protein